MKQSNRRPFQVKEVEHHRLSKSLMWSRSDWAVSHSLTIRRRQRRLTTSTSWRRSQWRVNIVRHDTQGLCLGDLSGHCRTETCPELICIVLVVSLRSLNHYSSLRSHRVWSRFSSWTSPYLAAFILLSVQQVSLPHCSMMPPPLCFMVYVWWDHLARCTYNHWDSVDKLKSPQQQH